MGGQAIRLGPAPLAGSTLGPIRAVRATPTLAPHMRPLPPAARQGPARPGRRCPPMRLPRLTLLQAFGVVSLLVIAALGATLGTIMHGRIEHRAQAESKRLAVAIARVGMAGQIQPGELDRGPL